MDRTVLPTAFDKSLCCKLESEGKQKDSIVIVVSLLHANVTAPTYLSYLSASVHHIMTIARCFRR